MTYNIQGHAASRESGHLEGVAAVIAEADADVVCLQEVHCRTRRSARGQAVDQAEELARMTGLRLAFGRSCGMDGGDYGNALLTTGDVTASEVTPLPGTGEPRSLMRCDVTLRKTSFSVFVTHLSAWGRLLRRERLAQVAMLGEVTAGASLPRVLAGDFNVTPRAEEIRALLSHGHLRPVDDMRAVTYPRTRQRLDYVFCDARWRVERTEVLRVGPSDHWPLVADLELES